MNDIAVDIKNIKKTFGTFQAVKGISFSIKKGEIFGILGPNGAGKTTTLNMILGLLKPTSGSITIEGLDNVKDSIKVKQLIGFMTQETVVDGYISAIDNLNIFAKLYHVPENEIKKRVDKALDDANLKEFANRPAGTFSGGMQRRLNLVKSMLQEPSILILDEPTTGLDVQSRIGMWDSIKKLNQKGITVILTTQYLEESDALCDRIAIIDHGEIKAIGTASQLKRMVSEGNILEITLNPNDIEKAKKIISSKFKINLETQGDKIRSNIEKNSMEISIKIAQTLEKEKINVLAYSVHLPTMDDVFIKLTGSSFRDSTSSENVASKARFRR
ncbi:MAG: ATP-binding cassette domain-containing protein [Candidatus Micrarchaeaceae archaeon]